MQTSALRLYNYLKYYSKEPLDLILTVEPLAPDCTISCRLLRGNTCSKPPIQALQNQKISIVIKSSPVNESSILSTKSSYLKRGLHKHFENVPELLKKWSWLTNISYIEMFFTIQFKQECVSYQGFSLHRFHCNFDCSWHFQDNLKKNRIIFYAFYLVN